MEGQCGVESAIIVQRPTTVLELHGVPGLQKLKAGKLNSAAILDRGHDGEAWTWGDGKAGKLGLGNADPIHEPHRVESLVGRASIADVALGEHHTIFLDRAGGIWACGENKEGQCGLGTPLEVIASQHRKAFYDMQRPRAIASHGRAPGTNGTATSSSGTSGAGGRGTWSRRDERLSAYLKNLMQSDPLHQRQHRTGMQAFVHVPPSSASSGSRAWAGGALGVAGGGAGSNSDGLVVSALGWGGFDMESHLNATGMQPGQLHTPMRIGRDQHLVSSLLHRSARAEAGEDLNLELLRGRHF